MKLSWLLPWLLLLLSVAGCDRERALNVYAASSLTEAFTELERAFETHRPDVNVRLSFAGSQVLRLQIEQGAPAGVFASADPEQMQRLERANLVEAPTRFASNALTLIVPTSNPAGILTFKDLPRARRLVIGAPDAPIGRYTRALLARAGGSFEEAVRERVVSQESNTRLVRAKVALNEADAAIVYETDARAVRGITRVEIPPELSPHAAYLISVVRGGEQRDAARAWVSFVRSEEGRAILSAHGFTSSE